MSKEVCGNIPFDREDPKNAGIIKNQLINGGPEMIRMITFYDEEHEVEIEFITNLKLEIKPGILAQLYKMRWDIEKSFDEIKNKFHEIKAWGKNLVIKRMQAQFIVLAYNMTHRLQSEIEEMYEIKDIENEKKLKARFEALERLYETKSAILPEWLRIHQRSTQIGVKFIRWFLPC